MVGRRRRQNPTFAKPGQQRNPAEAGFPLISFLIQEWFFNAGLATGIQSPPCWQIHVFGDLRIASTLINRWLESRYFSTSCHVALGAKLIPSAVKGSSLLFESSS